MSKFRFVRKNGKVLGPLTADRINHLFSEGKLAPDDELSEDQDGPWQSVATLQERMERAKKAKRVEAEKRRAAPPVDAHDVVDGVDNNQSVPVETPPLPTGDPSIPDNVGGLWDAPGFPDVSASVDPSVNLSNDYQPASSVYDAAVSVSPRRDTRSKVRSSNRSEELDATDPMRWVFPWRWETDLQPYPMLVVYLKFSKAILNIFYLLFVLLGFVCIAFMFVGAFQVAAEESSSLLLVSTFITIPAVGLLWWFVAQLIYIAGMATIDVLRCFLAIERNTRQ